LETQQQQGAAYDDDHHAFVTTGGRAFRLRSSLTAAIAAAALTALGRAPAAGAVAYDESV
jgi:hypothetical protein